MARFSSLVAIAAVTGESPSAQATRSFGAILPGRVVGRFAVALHASPAASMVSASRGALQALLQARAQAQAQARAQAQHHHHQQQQQRESLMRLRSTESRRRMPVQPPLTRRPKATTL